MEKLQMCRICLVQNVRMYAVINKNLHDLYEKLTNIPFVTEDSRPMLACFICYTKLKKCCRFVRKCLESEELFTQMMNEDYKQNPLITNHPSFYDGFIKTPIENISIVDVAQTEIITIKEEDPAVFERPDDIIELKEEHQNAEIKLENVDNSYLDVEDIPAHLAESCSEYEVALMENKTEMEEEQELIGTNLELGNIDNDHPDVEDTRLRNSSSKLDVLPEDQEVSANEARAGDSRKNLRNRVEKSKVGSHTHEQMREALQAIKDGKSIRQAATDHNIAFTTLQRYRIKEKNTQYQLTRLTPNYTVNQVFSKDQELILKQYYIKSANLFYGLSVKNCRQVAYELAKSNGIRMPKTWTDNQLAGIDWLRGFRQRHQDLTLRKPEACSLARASAFNMETVNNFYDSLENAIKLHPAFTDGTRIYNLDETGPTTVQKTQRVIAPKGRRNLCKVTSGEEGTLVTTCNIISAGGQAVPPVLIFPSKNTNPRMAVGTPPGSVILANPSGWMNSELFLDVMKHFIRRTGTSKEYPSILIMDNHESHLSIKALDLAKESGVTVLTLHPHISVRVQPLDVGIHETFKRFYYCAMNSWKLRNPECPVNIYDVGALIGEAFAKTMTPSYITQAFRKTGIFPFDRHIFSEKDFAPSSVTDRPENSQPLNDSSVQHAITDQQTILEPEENSLHLQITDSPKLSTSTAEETFKGTRSPSLLENLGEYSEIPSMPVFPSPEKSVFIDQSDVLPRSFDGSTSRHAAIMSTTVPESKTNPPRIKSLIMPDPFRKPIKAAIRTGSRKPRKLSKILIATVSPEKHAIAEQKAAKRKKLNLKG